MCWWVGRWFGDKNLTLEHFISVFVRKSLGSKFLWLTDWLTHLRTQARKHVPVHKNRHNHIGTFKMECMIRKLKIHWWIDWLARLLIQNAIFGKYTDEYNFQTCKLFEKPLYRQWLRCSGELFIIWWLSMNRYIVLLIKWSALMLVKYALILGSPVSLENALLIDILQKYKSLNCS